jgi:hypothetical protein
VRPYPDRWVPIKEIAVYLRRKTGVTVTNRRIGRWLKSGELPYLHRPIYAGGGKFVTKEALDKLIEKYTDDGPAEWSGGLRLPRVPKKPGFHFPTRRPDGGPHTND